MSSTSANLPERLLLVSCSARVLAQSAARAGIRSIALDLYADADTRETAEIAVALEPGRIGFSPESLLGAAARTAPQYPLVYGSGLDAAPELLEQLADGRELYGNPPGILRLLKTPDRFFALLGQLHIPFPEVRPDPPPDSGQWLIKSGCSEGGKGVRFCAQNAGAAEGEYYQRRLAGPALSALFLADGENVRIIGFNTLWTASHFGRPFLFMGAVNRADLNERQREAVCAYAVRLVRVLGLKGLNSLDFMADGKTCRVLEINPRPSATMALYDVDFRRGLVASHIAACRGRLDEAECTATPIRAFRAVFAPRPLVVREAMAWPHWCADRPAPGSRIASGEPFCTVAAEGETRRRVEALIERRASWILERL